MTFPSFPFFSLPDNCFYDSHYNFFDAPQFNGISIYGYLYLALALIIFLSFLIGRILGRPVDMVRCLWLSCWVMCLSVIAVQTSHQVWYLQTARRNIGHLSDDARYVILYEYAYEIARAFAARVPPGSPGVLISDAKIGLEADVDALPYFLFPRLDLVHRDRLPQYIVFYLKETMTAPLPGVFRPVVVDIKNPTQLWERVDDGR